MVKGGGGSVGVTPRYLSCTLGIQKRRGYKTGKTFYFDQKVSN